MIKGKGFLLIGTLIFGLLTSTALACGGSPTASPTATTVPPTEVPTEAPTQAAQPTASTGGSGGAVTIEVEDGSVARYIVGERLANLELPNDAIGETSEVSGTIAFNDDGTVDESRSTIEVNVQSLESDEDRRDNFIRNNALQSNAFPTAEFVVKDAPGMPWPLPESGEVSFQLTGDMTVHGVTQPVTWDVVAEFGSGSVGGQSTAAITFDQFDINKPSLPFILSVDDEIMMELDFVASVS